MSKKVTRRVQQERRRRERNRRRVRERQDALNRFVAAGMEVIRERIGSELLGRAFKDALFPALMFKAPIE